MPLFGLMAGSGGYVQGSGSKAVGHFSFDGWFRTPGYQEVLPLGSLFDNWKYKGAAWNL